MQPVASLRLHSSVTNGNAMLTSEYLCVCVCFTCICCHFFFVISILLRFITATYSFLRRLRIAAPRQCETHVSTHTHTHIHMRTYDATLWRTLKAKNSFACSWISAKYFPL